MRVSLRGELQKNRWFAIPGVLMAATVILLITLSSPLPGLVVLAVTQIFNIYAIRRTNSEAGRNRSASQLPPE